MILLNNGMADAKGKTVRNKITISLLALLTIGNASIKTGQSSALTLRDCRKLKADERTGCETIVLTKMAAVEIDKNLEAAEAKNSDIRTIKNELTNAQGQERAVKVKYKVDQLEQELSKLEIKKELLSSTTFSLAPQEYLELSSLLQNLLDDPVIKEKMEIINGAKRDLKERMDAKVTKIHALGSQIAKKTSAQRQDRNTLKKDEFIPLQQKIDTILLTKEVDEELNKVKSALTEKREKLDAVIDKSLTAQEKSKIEQLRNARTRKQLILDMLSNPEDIATTNLDKLLGLEVAR